MSKYGLQLRVPPKQQASAAAKPPIRPPSIFASGDYDEDDVEREISRQASKNKTLQKIEEQYKKAMEEDPSVFDYDGVYDEMKQNTAQPKIQDRSERKSKYIDLFMKKKLERDKEHEVIYERKLLKERSKDDHLYADKEKFVTAAYKKKLAEQAKWLEEERLGQIREEKEDVTKKSYLSDFYFGLNNNVAFGACIEQSTKPTKKGYAENPQEAVHGQADKSFTHYSQEDKDDIHSETYRSRNCSPEAAAVTEPVKTVKNESGNDKDEGELLPSIDTINERYKRTGDALASARERFLARKKAREESRFS